MKGDSCNHLKLKGLENKNAGDCFAASASVHLGSGNHFFAVGQEEQSPLQEGAAGLSFLADSL